MNCYTTTPALDTYDPNDVIRRVIDCPGKLPMTGGNGVFPFGPGVVAVIGLLAILLGVMLLVRGGRDSLPLYLLGPLVWIENRVHRRYDEREAIKRHHRPLI